MNYNVDEKGYYGDFGGAFIPEMLYPNVAELRENYLKISSEPDFKKEFDNLLKVYVGRPTPLYFAKRLSKRYNTKIYLKREDLCHTGAHKVNNTIGQRLRIARKNVCCLHQGVDYSVLHTLRGDEVNVQTQQESF